MATLTPADVATAFHLYSKPVPSDAPRATEAAPTDNAAAAVCLPVRVNSGMGRAEGGFGATGLKKRTYKRGTYRPLPRFRQSTARSAVLLSTCMGRRARPEGIGVRG